MLIIKEASQFVILNIFPTNLTNLEERITTWHKTKLSAFPTRVFKSFAKKFKNKRELSWIDPKGLNLILGVRGVSNYIDKVFGFWPSTYPLSWHFLPYKCWQKVNIFGLPKYVCTYLPTSSCQLVNVSSPPLWGQNSSRSLKKKWCNHLFFPPTMSMRVKLLQISTLSKSIVLLTLWKTKPVTKQLTWPYVSILRWQMRR